MSEESFKKHLQGARDSGEVWECPHCGRTYYYEDAGDVRAEAEAHPNKQCFVLCPGLVDWAVDGTVVGYAYEHGAYHTQCLPVPAETPGVCPIKYGDPQWGDGSVPVCTGCEDEIPTCE